jgi:tetratricopeptide (TPR) repeat protein
VKLLALVRAGEYVPHLRKCAKCRDFVEAAQQAVEAFRDLDELEEAVAERIDAVIENTHGGHRMAAALYRATDLHRAIVVRELLRRAEEFSGTNPSKMLDYTDAAVTVSDAMVEVGRAPAPELRIEALKQHATALRQFGWLHEASVMLDRAMALADETTEPEFHRAVLTLCAAIVEAEPDRAKFDKAIELAGAAGAVLDLYGDERRVAIARQTKAYALMVKNAFAEALPLLRDVVAELDRAMSRPESSTSACDLGIALASLAHCLIGVGSYEEAARAAARAEQLQSACGRTTSAARAAHIRSRAAAALGHFNDVEADFNRAAEIVFDANLLDEWAIMRLDYASAALAADPSVNVRRELEMVARVCTTLSATARTMRRQYAAEAMAYLRQIAIRDAVTFEAVDFVREYISRNASQPPVKFTPPRGGTFVM